MRELLEQLLTAKTAGRGVAFCCLVETRGSTPQKAGATMLVFDDGSQAGTLGGGCVEAEVKRRALAIMAEESAQIIRFQLDNDYGWDDGLICGGRMQVLVDPVTDEEALQHFRMISDLESSGAGGTVALVFDAEASGMPAAASYLFDAEGQLAHALRGTLEAGDAPAALRNSLTPLAERPRPSARYGVAYLPMLPRCTLVIVGGGHVGQAVGNLAAELDFEVTVVDDRPEYVTAARFPLAKRCIAGDIDEILPTLAIDANTYCLIVTRGHNHDEEALFHLVDRGARYVGMIGSKRKIKLIFDDLVAEGISRQLLEHVYAPVGLDIGSQTVMEIAVSITAELVAHRNLGIAGHHTRDRAMLIADQD